MQMLQECSGMTANASLEVRSAAQCCGAILVVQGRRLRIARSRGRLHIVAARLTANRPHLVNARYSWYNDLQYPANGHNVPHSFSLQSARFNLLPCGILASRALTLDLSLHCTLSPVSAGALEQRCFSCGSTQRQDMQ
jgi:hypothetical protein